MIAFIEETHTYLDENGNAVPSVTQILKPLHDLSAIPAQVLNRKAALGTAVHKACELHLLGQLDEETLHEEVAPYFQQFARFLAQSDFELISTERRVYHPRLRFAGTLDLFCRLAGKYQILDIKTASTMHPVYGPQTAAYEMGLRQEIPDLPEIHRGALQLHPDFHKVHPLNNPTDGNTFLAALTLHHWKVQHGEAA